LEGTKVNSESGRADDLFRELMAIAPGATATHGRYRLSCDAKDGFQLYVEHDGQLLCLVHLGDFGGFRLLAEAIEREERGLPVEDAEFGEPTTLEEFAEAMTPYADEPVG
jgi:hypothetical protein